MSDTNLDPIDLESLTDDEVLKLSPEEIERIASPSEEEEEQTPNSEDTPAGEVEEQSVAEDDPAPVEKVVVEETQEEIDAKAEQAKKDAEAAAEKKPEAKSTEQPFKADDPKPGTKVEDPKDPNSEANIQKKAEKVATAEADKKQAETAQDFFTKVTAPFKADGKDFEVKTPEDAIRLMQQGVNYSRRMQELKPVRALNHMLSQHGLNDPSKLSYLIDIHNGKPEAIQKLLKEKGIDPLDIDTSQNSTYQNSDYSENPKDAAFREAIENTMSAPGGTEILQDVNANWDNQSKEALKENPSIFGNLLEHKDTGVYDTIVKELNYQRTIGYLKDTPFLQAYHQVGEALDKAGVFNSNNEQRPNSEPSKDELAPIDTGPRKATLKTKSGKPNQKLSSVSQPSSAPSNDGGSDNDTDYSTLSDEDFLKLGSPG